MPATIQIAKAGARNPPTLPPDAVTRTFGIFGMKDSGKTNTGRVVTEGIVKVGGHAIVFDPVGVWWGATRAGEGAGIPGVVIGGEHGDVPLEETGGKLIAELALERQYKLVVVDMKLLRKGAQHRFLADCLEELYFRNRLPLSVVFEEADQTLPQNPRGMNPTLGRVLGAAEDIVKLGRSRGLGGILISQRLATVNKNVTEQIENLILLRLVGPNDIKAVKEWVQSNGDPVATAKVLDTIAKLEQGEAWMYSPGWLKLLERIRVRHARTLDSSATPTVEQVQVEQSATRAPVSLDTLRTQMHETVERAKANDPKELRKRIATLEAELATARDAPAATAEPEPVWPFSDEEVERALEEAEVGLAEAHGAGETAKALIEQATRLREVAGAGEERVQRVVTALQAWGERRDASIKSIDDLIVKVTGNRIAPARPAKSAAKSQDSSPKPAAKPAAISAGDSGDISAGAKRLYEEMVGLHPLALSRTQLATILRRGAKSSTLTQQLAELRDAGLIEDDRGRFVAIVESGNGGMSREELIERWQSALPEGPAAILSVLLSDPEKQWPRPELFLLAGFSPTSSTPVGHLKLLRDNGLAEQERGGAIVVGPAIR